MGMGFAPTWLRQVSPPPLLHKTTLTIGHTEWVGVEFRWRILWNCIITDGFSYT